MVLQEPAVGAALLPPHSKHIHSIDFMKIGTLNRTLQEPEDGMNRARTYAAVLQPQKMYTCPFEFMITKIMKQRWFAF